MIAGETFTVDIKKIHHVEEGKRIVFATMDTSCYAPTYNETYAFWKEHWEEIKRKMKFEDNQSMPEKWGRDIEAMSDCDFCLRYSLDLSKVPDYRLVEEVNRRIAKGDLSFNYKLEYRVSELGLATQNYDHTRVPKSEAIQI